MKIINPYNPQAFGKEIDKNEDLGPIAHILFKENYTRIGDNAFKDCTDLTEIYIPDNVTFIYKTAFTNCKELRVINFGNTRTTVAGWYPPTPTTDDFSLLGLFNLDYDIVVPDDLYNKWTTGTTASGILWRSNAVKPHIIKYSDYKYHPENHYRLFNKIKFSSASNGSVLGYKCEGNFTVTLYKSTDGQHWESWDGSDIVLNSGEFVYVYGNNPTGMASLADPDNNYCHFTGTGNLTVEGNVMSLLYTTGSQTLSTDYTLRHLFKGMTGLVHSKDLLLPATTTKYGCYGCMFQNCTALVDAPELPATTLDGACYWCMFDGCTSLISGPSKLPALSVPGNAYQCLFRGCSSLTSAPIISATSVGQASCNSMFMNCSSLTTAPELLAATLGNGCYQSMFRGCTNLINVQETLPATTLTSECYHTMFQNCRSLTAAPELPATTLASSCYASMFIGCSSLINAPELPATTLASNCYAYMFRQCTSLTTAPEILPATILATYCYNAMFLDCTSLTNAPILPAKTLTIECYRNMLCNCRQINHIECYAVDGFDATDCLNNWVSGVSNTGTFVKAALVDDWTRGISGIPTNWTVQEHVNDNEIIYQSIEL